MFTRCASAGQVERAAAVAAVHAVQGVHQSDAVRVAGGLFGLQVQRELMAAYRLQIHTHHVRFRILEAAFVNHMQHGQCGFFKLGAIVKRRN